MLDLEKILDWIKNKVDSHTTSIDGLNTSVDSINAKLTDSGWITLNDIIQYRKVNGIVYVCIRNANQVSLVANDWTLLGTLPTGFRPSVPYSFSYNYVGGVIGRNATSEINIEGLIRFYPGELGTSYLKGEGCFPVD